MNTMQQMPQMGGNQQMTDEELRKLAMLLQQIPEGEGLATINQNEAQLMIDEGGSGRPLSGTEGLGINGGPVRSYDSNVSGGMGETGDYGNKSEQGEAEERASDRQSGNTSFDFGAVSSNTGVPGSTSSGGWSPAAGRDKEGYLSDHPNYQGGGGGDGEANGGSNNYRPPPPPKYLDMNGKEFGSQAEADASNAAIKAAMSGIERQALTSDSTYERFTARNKDNADYAGLTPAQMETAYNTALTKSQEDAASQVPAMVESMNNYFSGADIDENSTYEEFATTIGENMPKNLSEATMRDMYENARKKMQRGEAFTLTAEEVAEFKREAMETATVDDAEGVTIGGVADATDTTVGAVTEPTETEVAAIASVTDSDIDAIFVGGTNKAEELLLARVNGTANSPAEQQLMRSSEQNLRMLLGATAGGNADPAKVRQLKNVWADMTQVAIGEAADLRSKESMAAESQLVELYRGKDTMKLNTKLANMEKDKQTAFKNGDMELAKKLSIQATSLQRVITQASLTTNTKLANLEKAKTMAIDQGKLDLATNIANLQKNLSIATVDAKLAVEQRSMDDALAMNAYKGQQALYGLESSIDIETMKTDLTKMGFDLSRDLAEMDNATRIEVARLTGEYNAAISSSNRDGAKENAIIGAIATAIGSYAALSATSDIRAKTNISPGSNEVESFLDALNSYKYEYKDPNGSDEDGEFVGIMAQDLEKTPMGASFVKDTPNGKMVDYGHGLAAILASQANIHDRIRTLEEG